MNTKETESIKERYIRRSENALSDNYNPLSPSVFMSQQEKERKLIQLFRKFRLTPLHNKALLEIGCGSGFNLLQLIRLGFSPENLMGNELLQQRYEMARKVLPEATDVILGDASVLDLPPESFDIIYQSTVFTSILDPDFQQKLADRMWLLTRPCGGILWYDFTYDNPNNPDVKGIPLKRLRELFPKAKITAWRITLAPPISRKVTKIHPNLYTLLNLLPLLRTHILCWIEKMPGPANVGI